MTNLKPGSFLKPSQALSCQCFRFQSEEEGKEKKRKVVLTTTKEG
jgi:hypothetical protein